MNHGRFIRWGVGVVLIGFMLVGFARPLVVPVTSVAVVNAVLVKVRAPIPGMVEKLVPKLGARVALGDPVMIVASEQVDFGRLSALQLRHAELSARRDGLRLELSRIVEVGNTARTDAAQYKESVRRILEAAARETEARLQSAKAEHDRARRRHSIALSLWKRGFGSQVELDDARVRETQDQARVEELKAALEGQREELEAAGRDVFIRNDPRLILQKADQLALRIPQARDEITETDRNLATVEAAVRSEEVRVRRLEKYTVKSPAPGVVWRRRVSSGQLVGQDEDVLEIADSRSVCVEAEIHQRFLDAIKPGDRVSIHFASGKSRTGEVNSVRTPGPNQSDSHAAVPLPELDLRCARLVVSFNDSSDRDIELVGRHVRIVVEPSKRWYVQNAIHWLNSWMRP